MKTIREQVEPIIREMLGDPAGSTTSLDIANEATRRLGVHVTDKYVSAIRNDMELGFRQIVTRETAAKYVRELGYAADVIRREYGL